MTSESNSLASNGKKHIKPEQGSNKVQAYISELKNRIALLKCEEERIGTISVTLLKKHIGSPFANKRLSPEDAKKIRELRKEVWESESGPGSVNVNNFQTALKMFQDLQTGTFNPNMEQELFRLRTTNHFIKKRVEDLQTYIAKLRDSVPNPEDDACEQLYQATKDILKKITDLDTEINDANSIIASTSKSTPPSRKTSLPLSGKPSGENVEIKDKEAD